MKNPFTDRRRLALFLSILVLLVIGGHWVGRRIHQEFRRALREAEVYGVSGGVRKYVRTENVSDEYNDSMDWLVNRLIRSRRPWSMNDAKRLIAILDNPPTDEYMASIKRKGTTIKQLEWDMKYMLVMPAISERIRHNDPMAPGVKEALSQALVAQLDVPIENTQLDAVQSVANARLVQMPIIRAKLVAMQLSTDDKRLADTIQGQLARFDYLENLRREGKLSERGVETIPE